MMKKLSVIFPLVVLALLLTTSCEKESINEVPTADAGTAQTIQLPTDSVTLTGTASDADGKVTGYLWSEVSGPNAAIIVNPGSLSTKVRGLIAGTYLFQLMAIDDLGATGLDTVSVQVNPAVLYTLNLQPHNNPTEVHIWGNSSSLEQSHNGAPDLGAASWTYLGTPVGVRGLLKFDLSSIPANATIVSAKLTLYSNPTPSNGDLVNANAGPDNTTLIQQVTSSWTASAVKWVNQPSTTTTNQVVVPHTNLGFLDLVDMNVKPMVQSMVTSNANYGFMIKLQTEVIYNSRIFASSFYSNQALHPKLVVEYTK
jgi:hypothetical protein